MPIVLTSKVEALQHLMGARVQIGFKKRSPRQAPAQAASHVQTEWKRPKQFDVDEIFQGADPHSSSGWSNAFRNIKRDLRAHLTTPTLNVMDEKAQSLTYLRRIALGITEERSVRGSALTVSESAQSR